MNRAGVVVKRNKPVVLSSCSNSSARGELQESNRGAVESQARSVRTFKE